MRDNLHAYDVCRAFWEFIQRPRSAAVYNLGGGRENSISVLEAISALEERTERKMRVEYHDQHRVGHHICYISLTRDAAALGRKTRTVGHEQ